MSGADGDAGGARVAVIFNPTKIGDGLRQAVDERAAEAGLGEPLWLETAEDDPGRAMARQARDAGVDVVLAAGGDGTVRVVASELAGAGIPLAIIPEGTGNLLARNLGIPLTESEAIAVAFGDHQRDLDVIGIRVDDHDELDRFAVMAGIGLDAAIMSNTDERLKKALGPTAYVATALRQLGREPLPMRVTVDDGPTVSRKALVCLVGNVSAIQGDLELIPGAEPDDGRLDVVIASPRRVRHWLAALVSLIARRPRSGDRLDRFTGRKVEIELGHPDEYQLDGDSMGNCRKMIAEIEPGALQVRMPPEET